MSTMASGMPSSFKSTRAYLNDGRTSDFFAHVLINSTRAAGALVWVPAPITTNGMLAAGAAMTLLINCDGTFMKRLTMRLSDARFHQHRTRQFLSIIDFPRWLNEADTRDRSNRLLNIIRSDVLLHASPPESVNHLRGTVHFGFDIPPSQIEWCSHRRC
jgi:hypothetical protein